MCDIIIRRADVWLISMAGHKDHVVGNMLNHASVENVYTVASTNRQWAARIDTCAY